MTALFVGGAGESWATAVRVASRLGQLGAIAAGVLGRARSGRDLRDGGDVVRCTRELQAVLRRVCSAHSLEIESRGFAPTEPSVIVANHLGYLDPIVLGAAVPSLPIAKGEVGTWPLLGPAIRELGIIFVERESPASGARVIRAALRALGGGASVLNFPEGTTRDGSSLGPFKRGIFGAAQIANRPIVPVAVAYDGDDLAWTGDATFLPHYLRTAKRHRVVARLAFGDPIAPSAAARPEDLARRAAASIDRMRRSLAR